MNLLASDSSDSPANARNQATADGHASIEAPSPPTEKADFQHPKPWYRQGKWRVAMLVGAIVVIGAVVGGVVGGTVGHKNNNNNNLSNGPGVSQVQPSTATLQPTDGSAQTNGPPVSTPVNSGANTAHTGTVRSNEVGVAS